MTTAMAAAVHLLAVFEKIDAVVRHSDLGFLGVEGEVVVVGDFDVAAHAEGESAEVPSTYSTLAAVAARGRASENGEESSHVKLVGMACSISQKSVSCF